MSNATRTFVDTCLAGLAFPTEVDDWVETWHQTKGSPFGIPVSLDEYLGFSSDEGDLWAERPEVLRFVIAAHQYGCPVRDLLASQDDYAVAARADSPESAIGVLRWLRETGRLSAR